MKKLVRHVMLAVMIACSAGAGAVIYTLVTSVPVIHETYLDPSDRAPIPPVKVEPSAETTPTWSA